MKQILFSMLLLLMVGCSSDTSVNSGSPQNEQDDPAEETVNLHQQLLFYVLFSGGENVTYFANYDISISETTTYVYKVVPDLNYFKEISRNTSYDWATSSMIPHTENGAVYQVKSYGLEPNDSHVVSKLDIESDETLWEHEYVSKTKSSGEAVNIIGNTYYFKTYVTYDVLDGDEGGDLWKSDVTAGADTTLLVAYDDLVPQYGELLSSQTALYDIDKTDDTIKVYRRDLSSGASTLLASYLMDDTQYESYYYFKIDSEGSLYFLRKQKDTTMVEVWRLDLNQNPLSQTWEQLFSYDVSNLGTTSFLEFDVDNGYCMLAYGASGMVYIYNIESGEERLIDFGIKFIRLEFLYYE